MLRSLVGSEMCIRDSLYSAIPCVHSAAADGPISLGYQLKFVDTTKHPLAVCNDGTPAAYYLHTSARSRDWVLHQQGGWWCWDDYSCAVRWAHFQNHTTEKRTLMSTGQLAALTAKYDTFNGEKNTGIMAHNSTGNPMSAASKVFVVYCSSDSHAGNRSAGYVEGAGDSKWHFRGKEIVKAVLGELNANHGLGTASSVVLTGGSAGGMATLNNADYVGEMLKEMAPGVNFVAMPDSGFFVDVMPGQMCSSPESYECKSAAGAGVPNPGSNGWSRGDGHSWLGTGQTMAQQMQSMLVYTRGLPDEGCSRALGEFGAWRCFLGQYGGRFVESKTLWLQNQIDEWQGFWNGFFNYSQDPRAYGYAGWFRAESRRELGRAAGSTSDLFVFSPNCYHHGLSYDSRFWEVRVDGWSSGSMLEAILSGDDTMPQVVIDDCHGLPCSPGSIASEINQDCLPVKPPRLATPH
eukprot:TRINITY_DN23986_c0_g1_i1.p1 TRINITY_DN23986_c0_g1~~TRINITY_DN23986_c0_g1_i1.p1  ORF type:complete len:463 (+),score=96.44 TRINITY_DN23986_c0_g1_i1:96-1484(+)